MDTSGREPLAPAFAAELARAIAPIPALLDRQRNAVGRSSLRHSAQAIDAAHPLGRYVREQAHSFLGGAADHLNTWHDLAQHLLPSFAHMTLLRAVVENAAWTRWLVDPTQTTEERVTRGVAAQLKDYSQRHEFEHSLRLDELARASGKHGGERRADLVRARDEHQVPVLRLPTATAVCDAYVITAGELTGGAVYRLLSAFAHGRQWTMLISRLEDAGFDASPGGRPMRVSANEDAAIVMTLAAVRQFAAALEDIERYPRAKVTSGA